MSQSNNQGGLEAIYLFENEDYDGGRGAYRDRSGHGRNLSLNGGVGVRQPSPLGSSALFDGADDYGRAAPPNGGDHLLVSAFLRYQKPTEDPNDYGTIVSNGREPGSGEGPSKGWFLGVKGENVRHGFGDGSSGEYYYVLSPGYDRWFWTTLAIDTDTGVVSIWVDGEVELSQQTTLTDFWDLNDELSVGDALGLSKAIPATIAAVVVSHSKPTARRIKRMKDMAARGVSYL
ncbi:hypothetical protein C453_12686 [Haloferax elongans ATCC BAA-1513]|uniref:LamG domain-containing protein n=1 Tax=Haloferax elongans ATCC BAA-1513 TaxID=1230453 RepID=M0HL01_HALEO|nr:hypothetical protein [Haloferax elongans]ELZ84402.1 hypothetical protein C453_12686 [Haloferax elongans ATCC BAA-1513]